MRRSWQRAAVIAACLALAGGPAGAQPSAPDGNKALAKQWANKAKDRLDAGDFQGALDAIHEAEKHARPPTFTRFEAQVTEKLGRLVEALVLYQAVIDAKLDADAPPAWVSAQESARAEQAALAARVPKLQIVVTGTSSAALTITLDGKPFDSAQVGKQVRVDPGAHEVTVTPPQGAASTKSVQLKEGDKERVAFDFTPAPGSAGPVVTAAPTASSAGPSNAVTGLKFAALGLAGIGLIGGAITGGIVLGEQGKIESACDLPKKTCSSGSKAGIEQIQLLGTMSTVGFAAGGAFAVAGALLWFLPGKKAKPRDAAGMGPALDVSIGVGAGSVTLQGAF